MTVRRLLALAVCAVAMAGCGNNKGSAVVEGDTEGIWIDVGALDYHVQGSRQLNPAQVPDDRYLEGVPEDVAQPTGKETWFAVFLRIENKTDHTAPTADEFEIEDTEGDIYKPVALDAKVNPFAYTPQKLTPDAVMPHADSTQDFDSPAGSKLLFKLPLTSYQTRPLAVRIHAPAGSEEPADAEVNL
ncbi:MAG: hypothetical protein QOG77_1394, partial [Solirubrobacteraceae bacterium]|nr:hypothetical protein [Solirubrobacteraceae bacterium]